MNYLDLAILLILGVSVAIGLYSGFLSALFNSAGMFISLLCAWLFYGYLSTWFLGHTEWVDQLIHYTEGASRLATDTARSPIALLTMEQVAELVFHSGMPEPFARLIQANIAEQLLLFDGALTLGDYFNSTVVHVSINLISFVMLFMLLYAAFSFVISATAYVVKFPILRTFDWLAGAIVGLGRGFILAMILCSLIPIVLAVLPQGIDFIDQILETSIFVPHLLEQNPILEGIKGVV